jgi:serpin B
VIDRRSLLRSAAVVGGAFAIEPFVVACGSDSRRTAPHQGRSPIEPAALVRSDVARRTADDVHIASAADSVRALAADLYSRLSAADGNLVCSPYSVAVALAMTRVGALGETAREMDAVLRAGALSEHNDGMNALSAHLEALSGSQERLDGSKAEIELATANSLWGQSGIEWSERFLDTLAREYGAGMRVVDYVRSAEAARRQINAWTSRQTQDRIPQIIPSGVLDQLTRLVLVNAIYLKAPWEEPFEDSMTKKAAFTRADGSRLQVDMMAALIESASYARASRCQVARLPYAGAGLAMSVLLPDGDLEAFEAGLNADELTAALRAPRSARGVQLQMPKWRFRVFTPLNDTLMAMGMPTAFDPVRADFDGMTTEADLYISAVLHDAFIAVDEDGTEAAAATAVVMRDTSAMLPGGSLVLDRPFLFVIHDVETLTPLFMGRVSDPSA